MSDIVERLRKVEAVERELAHDCDMPPDGTANWEYAETCKEAAAEIEKLRAGMSTMADSMAVQVREIDKLRAALTPGAETKAAYSGEFHLTEESYDEDGMVYYRKVAVPWTTVKEIMTVIRSRAALAQEPSHE